MNYWVDRYIKCGTEEYPIPPDDLKKVKFFENKHGHFLEFSLTNHPNLLSLLRNAEKHSSSLIWVPNKTPSVCKIRTTELGLHIYYALLERYFVVKNNVEMNWELIFNP